MNFTIALVVGLVLGWFIHVLIERYTGDSAENNNDLSTNSGAASSATTSSDTNENNTTMSNLRRGIPALLMLLLGLLLIGRACTGISDRNGGFNNPLSALFGSGDDDTAGGEGDFVASDNAAQDSAAQPDAAQSNSETDAAGDATQADSANGNADGAAADSGSTSETNTTDAAADANAADAASVDSDQSADSGSDDAQSEGDAPDGYPAPESDVTANADSAAYPVGGDEADAANNADPNQGYPAPGDTVLDSSLVDSAEIPVIDTYGVPIFKGADLIVVGTSAPNAEIIVRTNGVLYGNTTADADGNWLVQGTVAGAQYEIIAYAVTENGLIPSAPVNLLVPK